MADCQCHAVKVGRDSRIAAASIRAVAADRGEVGKIAVDFERLGERLDVSEFYLSLAQADALALCLIALVDGHREGPRRVLAPSVASKPVEMVLVEIVDGLSVSVSADQQGRLREGLQRVREAERAVGRAQRGVEPVSSPRSPGR